MSGKTTIPKFPVLYQRKANEKVYIWKIALEEASKNHIIIHTEYGQLDGKLVHKQSDIKAGKAKRTVLEQAISEAQSDWNKKVNKGGYVESLKDAKTKITVKPMLAHNYKLSKGIKKGYDMEFPLIVEEKLDGNRCVAHLEDGKVILTTRTGKVIPHFEKTIGEELHTILAKVPPTTYLDGELYTDEIPFNELNGLFRKKSVSDADMKQMQLVKYYIFDCFDLNQLELKQTERLKFLESVIPSNMKHIQLIKYRMANNENDVRKALDEYLAGGFEGAILRDPAGIYELNKRSRYLLKFKNFVDEEFKVIGHHISDDKVLTVVWECETNVEYKGKKSEFSVKPQGKEDERAEYLKNAKKYIGKWLTVKYQDYTDDIHGIPRFPTAKAFRDEEEIEK